jgi:TRAP-type C4-dicarboxylate transport system permease small subunit
MIGVADERSPIVVLERTLMSACTKLTVALLLLLTWDVLWGVGTRFLLGDQARWTEELARLLLIWVSLLGGAVAYSVRAHLGLDLVTARIDPMVADGCRRFVAAVVYIFALAVLVVGGSMLLAERVQFGSVMPALRISRAWQYLAAPVAGTLICITAVRELMAPAMLPVARGSDG